MRKFVFALFAFFCFWGLLSCSKSSVKNAVKTTIKAAKPSLVKSASVSARNRLVRQEISKKVISSGEKSYVSYAKKTAKESVNARNPIKNVRNVSPESVKNGLYGKIYSSDCAPEHRTLAVQRLSNIKDARSIKVADYAYSQVGKVPGFPMAKYNQLLGYLDPVSKNYNPYLVERITKEGDVAIIKWLNSHHKNAKLIANLPKVNGNKIKNIDKTNNVFYFDPAYNENIKGLLTTEGKFNKKSYEELLNLSSRYPNGVKFKSTGFPDFLPYVYMDKNGQKTIVNIGKLQSTRDKDFTIAWNLLKNKGYTNDEINQLKSTHTWHHIEYSSKLELVPTDLHDMVRHTGGRATMGLGD